MYHCKLWFFCITFLSLPLPFLVNAENIEISESTTLPISKIVLYTSGVGYFQHDGTVQNDSQLHLPARVTEINDLLKSLVVQDLDGGSVSSIHYQSQVPLTKTLSSFSIDLSTNPTLAQLLTQLRGEPVQLTTPSPITGTILGVEKKTEWKEAGTDQRYSEVEYVNLLTSGRLQSIPLPHIQDIQLLNNTLNKELQQALTMLARSHDRQKKMITISLEGKDDRHIRMAYLRENPVWKTSYRLVLQDDSPPFLQGWGIVDNTTDHDWNEVQLSLVSGRPISFVMDLYQPLYVPRPIVKPELHTSLKPQTHSDRFTDDVESEEQVQYGGQPNFAKSKRSRHGQSNRQEALRAFAAPAPAKALADAEGDLRQGVTATAQGQETGELFAYTIQSPVSIPRHESAMLPILSQSVTGDKFSLYNSKTHATHPLQAFRLNNITDLSLMQGPITVFDDNAYAGDAHMKDLAPGQDRLISYALDLTTEVHQTPVHSQQELISAKLQKGLLIATRKALNATTYTVTNRSKKQKVVLIEHPYRSDWKLINTTKPKEQTRNAYRFAVTVDSEKTESLNVQEGKPIEQTIRLLTSGNDTIGLYLKANQISSDVKAALQRVVELRQQLSHTQEARKKLESRIANIAKDQKRIRENMNRLNKQSQLYTRYVKKLHAQETELEMIQQDLEKLREKETTQKQAFEEYVMGLETS